MDDAASGHATIGAGLRDRGLAYLAESRLDEAAMQFQFALALDPENAGAENGLGIICRKQGRPDEAVAHFRRAIACRPYFALPRNNLAWLWLAQGRLHEAAVLFEQALTIRTDFAEARIGLGETRLAQGRLDEAEEQFKRALAISSDLARAHHGLATVLRLRGELRAAADGYRSALLARPGHSRALAELVQLLRAMCAWPELEEWGPKLNAVTSDELKQKARPGEGPVSSMRYGSDLHHHLLVAQAWSRQISHCVADPGRRFSFDHRRETDGRLRIAYASGTFGNHPVSHYMAGVYAQHDRRRFDLFVYAHGNSVAGFDRLEAYAASATLRDICGLPPKDAAALINNDRIDVLVDLDGHTRQGKLSIFALRPAPVQVEFLGFPGTTGASFLDYIIVDETVCPSDHRAYYSEKCVYLPSCFAVDSSSAQAVASEPIQRSEHRLPEEAFVLCSFNLASKIDPVIFDCWARILRRLPGSVLWLCPNNPVAVDNLRAEAAARGVDEHRLIFAQWTDLETHINRLRLADLALDTCLYNGGATTSNALAAGVPVVTLLGGRFASRMSASMVRAVGLPDLVANTLDEYEALVLHLAHERDELRRMRDALLRQASKSPLFDTPRFVRNLERAYTKMWSIFQAGAAPREIRVLEDELPDT